MEDTKVIRSKSNIAKNSFFYFVYQAILFVIPLIIMPYLTHVLTDIDIGRYTFSYSNSYYFIVLSNLGISTYGQREMAEARENNSLRKSFWSLFYVHCFSSIIAIISYVVFALNSTESLLYLLIIPYVVSSLFDITWFFYGLEKFKLVTVISASFSVLKLILIFLFVRKPGDLHIYQIIVFTIMLIQNIVLFLIALKEVGIPKKEYFSISSKHLIPLLYFSLVVIAKTLYTYLDKTLIGLLIDDQKKSVAYYECADKIIAVPRMLIAVLSTVLFPRACSIVANNKSLDLEKYALTLVEWTCALSFISIAGLMVLSVPFSLLYYGNDYLVTGYTMLIMCPLIFIISFGNIWRMLFIIPYKKDKLYLFSIFINAAINILLNLLLIPIIGIYGAVIATICSETVALIIQMVVCKKYFNFKLLAKPFFVYFLSGILTFAFLSGIFRLFNESSWTSIILCGLISIIFYFVISNLLSFILRSKSIFSLIKIKKEKME